MNETLYKVLYHRWTAPATVGAICFAAGAATGYFVAKRRFIPIDDSPQQLELDFDRNEFTPVVTYDQNQLSFDAAEVQTTVDSTNHILEGVPSPVETEEVKPNVVNIFSRNDDWDLEAELASRTPDTPYILHVEEFENDEMGYGQTTITYYAGDDVLCDERDVPIYNKAGVVGDLKFGHGSNDPHVCYIRNERLHAEYEVLLHEGTYAEEVLGLTIEQQYEEKDLKHSRNMKFREY